MGADRRYVLRPSDQDHIMTAGENASEKTAYRARSEDEDFHIPRMRPRGKNGFDGAFDILAFL